MEHREGKRIAGEFSAEVFKGQQFFSGCSITNISQGGGYLSWLDYRVKEGDLLTLKIHYEIASNPAVLERKVMVVHLSDSGQGFMWVDTRSGFLAILNSMNRNAA